MKSSERRRLVLLYHFFHPDDVISARLFTELGERVAAEGWEVVAMPSVRSCHDGEARLANRETWRGIVIRRVWRPAWRQASNKGRLGNTALMLLGWTWRALWTRRVEHETVIIGTDPPLGVLAAIPWRIFRPRTRIIHWCHDLYPQAAVADGVLKPTSVLVKGLNALLRVAYRRCDAIADLGTCMRRELRVASGERREEKLETEKRLEKTERSSKFRTLTPWSLVEPVVMPTADEAVRRELFREYKLGLLYSGNLGRAHVYQPFVELARRLAGDSIGFCYAGRGPKMEELRQKLESQKLEARSEKLEEVEEEQRVASDERRENTLATRSSPLAAQCNVSFAGFASEEELEKRLAAADVHMVSLHPNWTGTVVPSKFFGALAVGRPVLFAGRGDSAIAIWIRQYGVGWVLEDDASIAKVAEQLRQIAHDPDKLTQLQLRCFEVYHQQFSKARQMDHWMAELTAPSQGRC